MRTIFIFFLITFSKIFAFEYDIAICAIFQNEARFMKEWIEFHRMIGVEHFYLYNNRSEDEYLDVLSPYIKQGLVELIDWDFDYQNIQEWNRIQCKAYEDCVRLSRSKVKWLALIDLDEFIVPVEKNNLKKILKQYSEFSGLGINWQTYGTSSIGRVPDDKLMIEVLNYKLPTMHEKNLTTKCIVKPAKVSHIINPHWVFFREGFKVNSDKIRFDHAFSPTISIDKIRINHYIMRDLEYMLNVKYPRIKKRHADFQEIQIYESDEECCQELDDIMSKFIPALKSR